MTKGPGKIVNAPARERTRSRLADVARLAGVGIATVDRVLNERGSVSPETSRQVLDAARQLRLARSLPTLYRRGLRLDVVVTDPEAAFSKRLSDAFAHASANLDRSVIVQRSFADAARADELGKRIRSTRGDALIIYSQESAAVIDAITEVTAAGIPVVTLASDLPTTPRLQYVGIDHYSAGRTAAFFVARMTRRNDGPAIVCCNSLAYRAQAERVSGFRDGLADHAPGIVVGPVVEAAHGQIQSERAIADVIFRFPRTIAVYDTTGVNVAAGRALESLGMAGKVVFIGHELTEEAKQLLAADVLTLTIDQNPEQQVRTALDLALRRLGYSSGLDVSGEVAFTVYGPENV